MLPDMPTRDTAKHRRQRPNDDGVNLEDRHWFHIGNVRNTDTHVYIYNEIGYWGITADDFVAALEEVNSRKIILHINSPGGSVFEGVAIYNALRDHTSRIEVQVDGVAASAASFIAMAGDVITMNRGSEMMIHNAHGLAMGDATVMQDMSARLTRQNRKIAAIYQERADGPLNHWLQAMEAETWYDPHEAVAAGLADRAVTDADDDGDNEAKRQARNFGQPQYWAYTGRDEAGPPPETPEDEEPPPPPADDDPDTEAPPAVPAAPEPPQHPDQQAAAYRAALTANQYRSAYTR